MTEAWERRLMKAYGLRAGEYDELLAAQGGVCAICGKRPGRVRLAVDHDHITSQVRGLLHVRCNRAIGPFEWSLETITRAITYLERVYLIRTARIVPHG